MNILCALSKYNYGDPVLGLGIEYVAFTSALRNMGHCVSHLDTGDRTSYATAASLNRALLTAVSEQSPDVLLTVQKDCEIWIETLEAIRASGETKTITWTTDDSFKFEKVSQFIAPHYDLITTTYDYRVGSYHAKGLFNVAATQWAANSEWLQSPIPASSCQYDVSFVGINYGDREHLVESLRSEGIEVECFGKGWPNGPVATGELPRIFRNSRISLNFSAGHQGKGALRHQIKARTFEIPGAGGFLLTEQTPGLEKYYIPGKEIATFDSASSLASQVRYYLQNPSGRDAIAKAGHDRTRLEHTYEKRFSPILEALVSVPVSPAKINRQNLAQVEQNFNSVGPALKALRWCLLQAGAAIWGTDRGAKAARRLTFEASWRLTGEKTFTASGIPGRLFPRL